MIVLKLEKVAINDVLPLKAAFATRYQCLL